jgi:sugar/nucleoside kinase (ribokinase family)
VVTAAEAGAAIADGDDASWVAAPAVASVVNPIGAGDAFVGGLALALERGEPFAAAVAAGIATASASVETDVAGVVVPGRVAELLAAV